LIPNSCKKGFETLDLIVVSLISEILFLAL
jgi:hypothetical protein